MGSPKNCMMQTHAATGAPTLQRRAERLEYKACKRPQTFQRVEQSREKTQPLRSDARKQSHWLQSQIQSRMLEFSDYSDYSSGWGSTHTALHTAGDPAQLRQTRPGRLAMVQHFSDSSPTSFTQCMSRLGYLHFQQTSETFCCPQVAETGWLPKGRIQRSLPPLLYPGQRQALPNHRRQERPTGPRHRTGGEVSRRSQKLDEQHWGQIRNYPASTQGPLVHVKLSRALSSCV